MTLQQDETLPYTVLLQELRKFGILTTDLSRSDRHRLLRALARAPENQLVIPVLFVLLYSEWYRRHNAQMDATKDDEGWLSSFCYLVFFKDRRKEGRNGIFQVFHIPVYASKWLLHETGHRSNLL